MRMFEKILIANRGEIACRVMRTARALGYRTVAVFSDADAQAAHVALADEAVRIGPAPAGESYLSVEAILDVARRSGADAVHPGYGFLSENAGFARACADAGLVFIGPPAEAIEAMGDKAAAKRRMLAAGVPCAPGYLDADASDERLTVEAERLGYPLLVKAVAGGGGRGMRLLRDSSELAQALLSARREAQAAFGDDTLMLERLIEHGRHIEIQVFADAQGNAVFLGERDCSAQRRRQKVIEEAPSPFVDEALRAAMGRDAVAAALAVGYRGAGTVEFIVDETSRHYFLEMNTRLQVEHPVTECITGFDLVEWQIRIAAGQALTSIIPRLQDEVTLRGHAIEARLYAEDPYEGFAPQSGRIGYWHPWIAAVHPGVRIDNGVGEGDTVTPFYDPLLAKIIAYGRDRDDAIRRLTAALEDAPLLGLRNNGRFLRDLVQHPSFKDARVTTATLDAWSERGEAILKRPAPDAATWALAAAARVLRDGAGWRPDSVSAYTMSLSCDGETRHLRVRVSGRGEVVVSHDGIHCAVRLLSSDDGRIQYEIDGVRRRAVVQDDGRTLWLSQNAACFAFEEPSLLVKRDEAVDEYQVRANLTGVVVQVAASVGDRVSAGQPLICVEAMKMELWYAAQADGTVAAVHVQVRDAVESGAVLLQLTPSETI